ncbi:MAG TPA: 2-hydroxyacyl-CoA dehydratase family protein [Syntrophomonadaceae bacterium]|nr:2-hydroxyacyl-CoA dehydratase family protein [Syntrophomonadaceae bacterium]
MTEGNKQRIGFTTSIPVEIIFAAGKTPVDMNNIFIGARRPGDLVDKAEEAGYPRSTCGWIKGLYATTLENPPEALIAVMEGDCSNTQALMETLQLKGVNVIPFAYPFDRDGEMLQRQIDKLMKFFQVDNDRVLACKRELDSIRRLCRELDRMTWQDNLISGWENHYYLVSASDFWGQPALYQEKLSFLLAEARKRQPFAEKVRLAYIGVPPIFTDLYPVLENMGARVVFNEVQRQFSMPYAGQDLVEQYLHYTYPYGAFARLEDIQAEVERRNIDGVIHYTQTFCYRQIEDLIYREKLSLPFLTLEGDKPGPLDARSRMRLEAFVHLLGKKSR